MKKTQILLFVKIKDKEKIQDTTLYATIKEGFYAFIIGQGIESRVEQISLEVFIILFFKNSPKIEVMAKS